MLLVCVQRNIRSLKQLVSMNDDDRRLLLRQLTDSEYRDVLSVCAMMPSVDITAHCEGLITDTPRFNNEIHAESILRSCSQTMNVFFRNG